MPLVTIKVFEEELSESQSQDLKGYGSNYPVCRGKTAG
jgi:hypothetical protein